MTKTTPWDIYVDECKIVNHHSVGFMIVPNTASFAHKLFKARHHPADREGHTIEGREIHWSDLHRGVLQVAVNWIDLVFQHNGIKFFAQPWDACQAKELVILRFLTKFCKAKNLTVPPHDIVVILDHDSSHARAKIQNRIREVGKIARCYHLDSAKNDCIQCCDLLLGCVTRLRSDPTIRLRFADLEEKWKTTQKLSNSEVKHYLAGYLASRIDENSNRIYDKCLKSSDKKGDTVESKKIAGTDPASL